MHNPKASFRLLSRYYPVIAAAAEQERGVSLTRFRELLDAARLQDSRSASSVLDTLAEHNLIERSAESDDEWTVALPIRQAMAYLSGRYGATLPGALQGMLASIKDQTTRLRQHIARDLRPEIELSRQALIREIDKALYASYEHSHGIQSAVFELKMASRQRSLAERHAQIIGLHDQYLEPIKAMVDTGGSMQECIKDLLALIRQATATRESDGLESLKAHAQRFQRESLAHFEAARQALLPLYTKVRKDHAVSVAVSAMLSAASARGLSTWNVGQHLGVVRTRIEAVVTDTALLRYLVGALGSHGDAPQARQRTLVTPRSARLPPVSPPLFADDLVDEIAGKSDALAYLFDTYPEQPDEQLLAVYADLLLERVGNRATFAEHTVARVMRGYRYTYAPMTVHVVDGGSH
jgi:hypothetical protein